MDVNATKRALEALQQAANRYYRPAGRGDREISITPLKPATRVMLDDYAALGVSRLIPMLGFYPQETLMRDLEQLATELIDS